jgi:hypothetical protein
LRSLFSGLFGGGADLHSAIFCWCLVQMATIGIISATIGIIRAR